MSSLSAPRRWAVTTATRAPPRANAAAASEFTARPARNSKADRAVALEEDLRNALEDALDEIGCSERIRGGRIDRHDACRRTPARCRRSRRTHRWLTAAARRQARKAR